MLHIFLDINISVVVHFSQIVHRIRESLRLGVIWSNTLKYGYQEQRPCPDISEDLQGVRLYNFSGQSMPVYKEKGHPNVQREATMFYFLVLSLCVSEKSLTVIFVPFLQIFVDTDNSSLILLFSRVKSPSFISLFLLEKSSTPFIIFATIHWNLFSSSISLVLRRTDGDTVFQMHHCLR